MAKVTVEIKIGNEAMLTGYDIATALQKVSFIAEEARIEVGLKISIFDENGNNVGSLQIVEG